MSTMDASSGKCRESLSSRTRYLCSDCILESVFEGVYLGDESVLTPLQSAGAVRSPKAIQGPFWGSVNKLLAHPTSLAVSPVKEWVTQPQSLVILMMEEEQPEGLSARKLVVETVKHNVLTAYTLKDGIDLLHRFPNVDIVMVHARLLEEDPNLLDEVKAVCPGKPIILATPFASETHPGVDFVVDSHRPQDLVNLLNSPGLPE